MLGSVRSCSQLSIHIDAWLWRAEALRGLSLWDDSIASVDRALALDGDRARAYIARAVALQRAGREERRCSTSPALTGEILSLLGDEASARLRRQLLARPAALLERGEAAQAEAAATRLLEADPALPQAWLLRCEARRRLRAAAALEDLEAARRLDEHAAWLYLCGRKDGDRTEKPALNRQTYETLGRAIDDLAGLGGTASAWLHAVRGEAAFKMQDDERAVAALSRSLALEPDQPKTLGWLAECRYRRGEAAAALDALDEAVRRAPGQAGIAAWRGQLLLRLGRYARASRQLEAALELDRRCAWAYGWRGACRLKLGQPRAALADFARALSLDPADAEALVWRSEAHRLAGRPAAALADAERALSSNPDTPWALIARFLALRAAGRAREAARALPPLHGLLLELMPGREPSREPIEEAERALEALLQAAGGDRARLPPPMLAAAADTFAQRRRKAAASR